MDGIFVGGVTKTYRIGIGRARVREMLPWPFDHALKTLFPRWWMRDTFDALDDVTFSIPRGTSLGIVGHNGAGKTTLLKVIAGVTSPSAGIVQVSGRVAALIDVIVGFHPDLTGRENVFLFGAVHGFNRRSMMERTERVFDFAEIDELADTPLKRYSAGMVARLGFAIITSLDVDVLLVDEVLAVGDASFQRKCVRWLDEYQDCGGTLLFVSHNLSLVRNMTARVLWLDHGRVAADGPTETVLAEYARAMERRDSGPPMHRKGEMRKQMASRGLYRWGAGGARVEEVHVEEPSEDGSELNVTITYEASALHDAVFCVGFMDESGREIGAAASPPLILGATGGSVSCRFNPLPLRSGIYFPIVTILSSDGRVRDQWRLERAVVIERNGEFSLTQDFGPVDIAAAWSAAVATPLSQM